MVCTVRLFKYATNRSRISFTAFAAPVPPQRRKLLSSWGNIIAGLLLGLICMVGLGGPAFTQSLFIKPACGPKGTSVSMTGSGWAEPQPLCHYNFFFDGATFAPQQPNGLYGPPNSTGTVPATATLGDHTIRVELRIDSTDQLQGCRQDTFKVVTSTQDPFNGGQNVKPGGAPAYGAGNIVIDFDPTNSCAVSKCTAIRAIQAVQQLAYKGGVKIRNATFSEFGLTPPDVFNDANITPAGWTIDSNSKQPYYTGGYAGHSGEQSSTPKVSELIDRPSQDPSTFPADIDELVLNFETNFFCDEGEDRGQFFGQATWSWHKTKASPGPYGAITAHSNGSAAQPSPAFFEALNLYDKTYSYLFPTIAPKQLPPGQGGQACK